MEKGISKPKRYYWLKLHNDYFNQLEQKKMKVQEHGASMQIIYLRMMLLSLNKEGMIYYQGVYDTLVEELAVELDESVELIQETLNFLVTNGMAFIDDENNCLLQDVCKYTGSESESAERMRNHRQKLKMSQCDNDVI